MITPPSGPGALLRARIGARPLVRLAADVWDASGSRNIGLAAAGIGFYALFSVFPALAALIGVVGWFADPAVIADQVALLKGIVPDEGYDLIAARVDALLADGGGGFGWATLVALAVAMWSARLGVSALMMGLNAAHGLPNRSGLRHLAVALMLTLVLIGIGVVAINAIVVLPVLLAFIPTGPYTALALRLASWAVTVAIVVAGLSIIYRYGPNRPKPGRWFPPGLWVAVTGWAGASFLLSWYLAGFGNYDEIYGSLGAVIILLLWFYLGAYFVLLGAVINCCTASDTQKRANPEGAAIPG